MRRLKCAVLIVYKMCYVYRSVEIVFSIVQ